MSVVQPTDIQREVRNILLSLSRTHIHTYRHTETHTDTHPCHRFFFHRSFILHTHTHTLSLSLSHTHTHTTHTQCNDPIWGIGKGSISFPFFRQQLKSKSA